MKPTEDDWRRAALVCREVAELPDRTSPDDNADYMLVMGDELQPMIAAALAECKEELYHALDALLGWQETDPTSLGALAVANHARNVLAKARGETP